MSVKLFICNHCKRCQYINIASLSVCANVHIRVVEQHFMNPHVNTHEIKAIHAIIHLSHQTELQKGINPHFQKSVLFIILSSNVCSGLWMFESADVFLFSLQIALCPVHGTALKSLKQSQPHSQWLSISLSFCFHCLEGICAY